MLLLAETRIVA